MTQKITVKPIKQDRIADRLKLCWGHLDNWTTLSIVRKSREWLEKTNTLYTPTTLIAYIDRKPVGMIEFVPQKHLRQFGLCPCRVDEENRETANRYAMGTTFDRYLFISCLSVSSAHQGRGVGKTLLDSLLKSNFFKDFEGALVYARERDPNWDQHVHWPAGAKEFYLKAGFTTEKILDKPTGCMLAYRRRAQ